METELAAGTSPASAGPIPSTALATPTARKAARLQVWRRRTQTGFFLLFLLAPALNLLRFDLYDTQLWFLGMRWSLGIDALIRGEVSATQAAMSLLLRAFVPGLLFVALFLGIAYRYGGCIAAGYAPISRWWSR